MLYEQARSQKTVLWLTAFRLRSILQTETIYRWELIVAWETLRQIALTRTFLFLAAQQESSSDWTKPKAESLIALGEWASAVSLALALLVGQCNDG